MTKKFDQPIGLERAACVIQDYRSVRDAFQWAVDNGLMRLPEGLTAAAFALDFCSHFRSQREFLLSFPEVRAEVEK